MGQVAVTRTARVFLDDDGIIQEAELPGCEQSLEDARENLAANLRVSEGMRRPLLVDLSKARSVTREARSCYAQEAAPIITAVALLVGSPLSRMIGSFFIGRSMSQVPVRLFTSRDEATRWLQAFKEAVPPLI